MKTNATRILDSLGIAYELREDDVDPDDLSAETGKSDYPVYADETIESFEVISISAGVRGTHVVLGPDDYLRAVNGKSWGHQSR